MDQQTNNRRIHELMGRGCWHDVTPYVNPEDGSYTGIYRCIKCPEHVNDPLPDYYNDPIAAREALAFAVEQKGAPLVGETLFDLLYEGDECTYYAAAALAPASVLCEAFLAVMTDA